MSSVYRPQDDYRNWWTLGSTVEFNGPCGQRLTGKIVRASSNPDYIHVQANGVRYEVTFSEDNVQMVWGDDD